MNLTKYREQWLRSHRAYEKRAFRILRKMFRSLAKGIPFDQLTFANYSGVLENSITDAPIKDAYLQIYLQIGLIHGRRVGASINKDIKDFTFEAFTEAFKRYLYAAILQSTEPRRRMVRETFIDYIREIIGQGARDGKTIQEISRDITRRVNSRNFFYWQALRIARTETTSASNHAVLLAAQSSGIMFDKIWISAHDNRVRTHPKSKFDHLAMDKVKIDEFDYFNVDGELISFPGAMFTKHGNLTSGGNIINCRCGLRTVAKRDRNGRIMRKL